MTHDDGGGLSGYVPGGPTQHAGSGEPTGAFSAAGATAHAGSRPWRGPVRALPYPREDAERGPDRPVWYDIEDASGLIVTRCWNRRNADAIAAALNALAGCGCRAWLLDYADRQRCHKGGDTLAKWLEEIATRLPAPAAAPVGDARSNRMCANCPHPAKLHDFRADQYEDPCAALGCLCPDFTEPGEGVATHGPNSPEGVYRAAHGLIIGASRPDDAAEIGQLRATLAAKDAEIARLRTARDAHELAGRMEWREHRSTMAHRDEIAAELSTLRDRLAAAERELAASHAALDAAAQWRGEGKGNG